MAEEVKEEYTPIPVGSAPKRATTAEDSSPKAIKVLAVMVIAMSLLVIGCVAVMALNAL